MQRVQFASCRSKVRDSGDGAGTIQRMSWITRTSSDANNSTDQGRNHDRRTDLVSFYYTRPHGYNVKYIAEWDNGWKPERCSEQGTILPKTTPCQDCSDKEIKRERSSEESNWDEYIHLLTTLPDALTPETEDDQRIARIQCLFYPPWLWGEIKIVGGELASGSGVHR